MTLAGKAAIVTGSTSGIGLGIARAFAAAGANIVLNGFGDAAAIEAERAALEARHGIRAVYSPADISSPQDIGAMIELCARTHGSVDILVNNAGIQHTASIEEFPADRWDAVIAINLSGVFWAMHHALPIMRRQAAGRIINIASAHGLVASLRKAAYVAAKHGVVGLTKVAALETAGTGITVNAICPGWVHTPLVQRQIEANAAARQITVEQATDELLAEKQPSGQFVTPEQIGAFAVFLAGDAAAQITGAALPIDGGWTAR